jgi:NAD(P)-dependent dehydrogenase (short-subunit alcohol dehydrogenase family)
LLVRINSQNRTSNQQTEQPDQIIKNNGNMSLSGKNIIITGATSGLGVQIAALFSSQGASVFIGGRRAEKGSEVAAETKTTFHTVDVASKESSEAFFTAAEKHFGGPEKVDFIFLNSGVEGTFTDVQASSLKVEAYEYVYGVNVRGVILGIQHGLPLLRKGGTFIMTSSAMSILPFGGNPIYASSKAAVDSLVRSYAAQFAESDDERIKTLSAFSVNPTLYATEMSDRFTGGSTEALEGFAMMFNISGRPGNAKELAVILRDFVHGDLPYKSGENIATDADTHFPISEYVDRLTAAKA